MSENYKLTTMKELSIEEKAKAYDKAIEKFDVILNLNTVKESGTIFADDVRKIFPELKESESDDERIRKNLIGYIKGISKNEVCEETKDSWIAWLEKQGKLVDEYEDRLDRCACEYFNKGYKAAIEHQKEKPADKVEPKFKVGDWITIKE